MEHCFWIILTIMTGLTSGQSKSFSLTVQKGSVTSEYKIQQVTASQWNMRYPTGSNGDTITVSFYLSPDFTQMKTRYVQDTIQLDEYFAFRQVNWEKVRRFPVQKNYKEEGEGDLMVVRGERRIELIAKKGSFTYYPVIYSRW